MQKIVFKIAVMNDGSNNYNLSVSITIDIFTKLSFLT